MAREGQGYLCYQHDMMIMMMMMMIRELKELWNMKENFILIIIGALGIVTRGLVQGLKDLEIRGRVETIQTTALLRSARILRRVLET